MASQGLDKNKGVYLTELDLLKAVDRIWPLGFDLAADEQNSVMKRLKNVNGAYFDEATDALSRSWCDTPAFMQGWNWCNPPFNNIKLWVKKAYEESQKGTYTIMLLPMAHDTAWARDWVHGRCLCIDLYGRTTFVGQDACYPKGMMLCVYAPGLHGRGEWDWRAGDMTFKEAT